MKMLLVLVLLASCAGKGRKVDGPTKKESIESRWLSDNAYSTRHNHTHDYLVDGGRVEKSYWRDSAYNLRMKADAFYSDTNLVVLSFFQHDTLVKVVGVRSTGKDIVGKATYYLDREGTTLYKEETNYALPNLDSVVEYQYRERANFAALHKEHW